MNENTYLSPKQVDVLYDILYEYEQWKDNEGCYDLMDVINNIIARVKSEYVNKIEKLHYIFVDEV
jgi:hypothetical protein